MNRHLSIFVLLALVSLNSCVPKHEETIAIGILLTLPEEVYQQSVELNRALLKDHPNNITLDEKHIPHITLLQCYVLESDLPQIEKKLEGLYKTIKNDSLWADHLQYNKDREESFASIGIQRSAPLMALHEHTITLLEPFILPEGSQKAYAQSSDGIPIDDFTLDYVPKFVTHHSYDNYNPHISLGVARTTLLDRMAEDQFHKMHFPAKSIGIYQLGAFGTAQKRIWESE